MGAANEESFTVEVISTSPTEPVAAVPLAVDTVDTVGTTGPVTTPATPSGGAFDDFMTEPATSSTGLDAFESDLTSSATTPSTNMTSINLDGGNMGDSLI